MYIESLEFKDDYLRLKTNLKVLPIMQYHPPFISQPIDETLPSHYYYVRYI